MNVDESQPYLSLGQSKKLLAFGVLAALTSLPITGAPAGIISDIGDAVSNALMGWLEYSSTLITHAVFGTIGNLFAAGTEEFLFFAPPGEIEALRAVWFDFLPLFWAVLPVAGLAFFLGMQLFPEKEEADIYRFMERTLVAVIGLIVLGPLFTFDIAGYGTLDLFSATVAGVNEIGLYIFPDNYTLAFMESSTNSILGGFIASGGVALGIVAVAFVGWKFLIAILLVVATFYIVLAMRMLLIYSIYAMMPLFLALWVVDIGPMKYGKMVANLVFKLTAVMLLLGIVLSGILATTSAIAGQETTEDVQFADGYNDAEAPDGIRDDEGEINTDADDQGGDASTSGPPEGFTKVLLQLFAWFGGIVLCIALTTSLLGMVISMRGSGGTSSRIRQGRSPDAPTGPQTYGGAGAAAAGGAAGAGAAGGAGGGTVAQGDGATVINPANSDQGIEMGADGDMSTFSTAEATGPEPASLGEKASYVGGKYGGKVNDAVKSKTGRDPGGAAKNIGGKAKDKVEGAPDGIANAGSDAGDAFEEKSTDAIGGRTGKAIGKAGNYSATAAGYTPKAAMKGANLAKRGGQAYWSVFKQPDVGSSIGEARRIARDSPIGHPDKPGPAEDGVDDVASDVSTGAGPGSGPSGGEDMHGGVDDIAGGMGDGTSSTSSQSASGGAANDDDPLELNAASDTSSDVGGGSSGSSPEDTGKFDFSAGETSSQSSNTSSSVTDPEGGFSENDVNGPQGGNANSFVTDPEGGFSELGSGSSRSTPADQPEDLNLPDGKTSVVGMLEDYDVSSPAGHEGYTNFRRSDRTGSSNVSVDGESPR